MPMGRLAGYIGQNGRRRLKIDLRSYDAAAICVFWATETWPDSRVEFLDRDATNLRLSNLGYGAKPAEDPVDAAFRRLAAAVEVAARALVDWLAAVQR
jgi:hypothetical protein